MTIVKNIIGNALERGIPAGISSAPAPMITSGDGMGTITSSRTTPMKTLIGP